MARLRRALPFRLAAARLVPFALFLRPCAASLRRLAAARFLTPGVRRRRAGAITDAGGASADAGVAPAGRTSLAPIWAIDSDGRKFASATMPIASVGLRARVSMNRVFPAPGAPGTFPQRREQVRTVLHAIDRLGSEAFPESRDPRLFAGAGLDERIDDRRRGQPVEGVAHQADGRDRGGKAVRH